MARLLLKILNANPYFGMQLTEQETKDILTSRTLILHLGTVDQKGHANIHPAWYYYDASTNKLYIQTGKQSKKSQRQSLPWSDDTKTYYDTDLRSLALS